MDASLHVSVVQTAAMNISAAAKDDGILHHCCANERSERRRGCYPKGWSEGEAVAAAAAVAASVETVVPVDMACALVVVAAAVVASMVASS